MFHLATDQSDSRACLGKGARDASGNSRSTAGYKSNATAKDSLSKDFIGHILCRGSTCICYGRGPGTSQAQSPESYPSTVTRHPLTTRNKRTRLDNVDLTFHVGPFDVLLTATKDALDRRCCSHKATNHIIS